MADVILSNQKLGEKSLMSFPSKFDGKCKDCGIEHKQGETIDRNASYNWCKNGMNCTGVNVPKPKETESPKSIQSDGFVTYINKEVCMLQEIETLVKDKLGPGAVDAKVGMFVKEIYKQQKLREKNP